MNFLIIQNTQQYFTFIHTQEKKIINYISGQKFYIYTKNIFFVITRSMFSNISLFFVLLNL